MRQELAILKQKSDLNKLNKFFLVIKTITKIFVKSGIHYFQTPLIKINNNRGIRGDTSRVLLAVCIMCVHGTITVSVQMAI